MRCKVRSALPQSSDIRGARWHVAFGRVEDERGSLGHAATLRFSSPLIEPDVRISRPPASWSRSGGMTTEALRIPIRELIDKDALSEAHPPSGGRSSWREKVRANVLPSIPNVS